MSLVPSGRGYSVTEQAGRFSQRTRPATEVEVIQHGSVAEQAYFHAIRSLQREAIATMEDMANEMQAAAVRNQKRTRLYEKAEPFAEEAIYEGAELLNHVVGQMTALAAASVANFPRRMESRLW